MVLCRCGKCRDRDECRIAVCTAQICLPSLANLLQSRTQTQQNRDRRATTGSHTSLVEWPALREADEVHLKSLDYQLNRDLAIGAVVP